MSKPFSKEKGLNSKEFSSAGTIIAFRILNASLRGTEVAIYDYAIANEIILNNKSIIIIANNAFGVDHNREILNKFVKRFPVFFYDNTDSYSSVIDIENILIRNNCKILYTIAFGAREVNDPTLSINGVYKTALHCVFTLNDPHADTYVPISHYLARKHNKDIYVPHIISLLDKPKHLQLFNEEKNKSSLREKLNIPQDALVFGRHGGYETFNIMIVWDVINNVITSHDNIYFIFVNTYKFIDHPRIFFLDSITSKKNKIKFIMACDGMIHARYDGETFGLACGEFSVCNKPIITCPSGDLCHIDILKDGCMIYRSPEELINIFLNFNQIKKEKEEKYQNDNNGICVINGVWSSYSQFNMKNVAQLWWKHLISPLI